MKMLQEMNAELNELDAFFEGIEQMVAEMTFITEDGGIDFVPATDEEKSKWGNPITKSYGDSAKRQKVDARRPRVGDIITTTQGGEQIYLVIVGGGNGFVSALNIKDRNNKPTPIKIDTLDMGKESNKYTRAQTANAVKAELGDDEGSENVRVFKITEAE